MRDDKITFDQLKIRQKYTAIWAFSESVFGGILHAFKIPFTGLFLGGFAVIFLSSISIYIDRKSDLIKVTFMVIAIKFMLSPNTPFTAYLAVLMQGLFAFLFFSLFKNRIIAISLLSFLTALWSVFQKLFVMTLIFGMNLWYSIDALTIYILNSFGIEVNNNFSMSVVLILVYFLIHIVGAFFFAKLAIELPSFLERNEQKFRLMNSKYFDTNNELSFKNLNSQNSKKKKWYKKPSRIILSIFLISFALITYINPELSKIKLIDVISMIIRAVVIIYLWFNLISPAFVKFLMKFINRNSNFSQVEEITLLFPEFKKIISFAWTINSNYPRLKRILNFIKDSLLLLMK
ncbi:MAG: hypothetical protein ACPL25_05545 [Ignavibacteria bacterium]